jgi:hypothetical protein
MKLYTFIMNFQGGIYTQQVSALQNAMQEWARKLDYEGIPNFGKKTKEYLPKGVSEENASPLDGLTNAWCFTLLLPKGFAIIHFVETSKEI